jgi:hypothetical protein
VRSLLLGSAPLALILTSGCASSPSTPSAYPAREEGCDVQVFQDAPTIATENIGPVSAVCGDDIGDDECLRELKDQTCKLGGDVVWGVADKPTVSGGKKRYSGRAAHTAVAGDAAEGN